MNFKLTCENPGDIIYTIKMTMTAKEWQDLEKQLERAWPSSVLSRHISQILREATQTFEVTDKELR